MIDFPQNPTVGQQFTAAGVTWVWDGAKWTASGLNVAYLPLAGGTLTGAIGGPGNGGAILSASDPPALDNSKAVATTEWVQSNARWGDNRIINGDMRIDQRNNGVGGTAAGYTVDRWAYGNNTGASRGSWQRTATGASSIAAQAGFQYCLNFTSGGAYTPAATDTIYLYQPIEADAVADFAYGTSGAQPVTLSFWVSSNQTGTFSGALAASGGTRSYPFTFSIPAAATWTKIALTIPGDTAGTWVMSGNGIGVYVRFDLGSGANFRGPPGAWASANYVGATGAVSIASIASATFNVTGVKLEIGSVATPFNRQTLAKSLADCQRYYEVCSNDMFNSQVGNATGYYKSTRFCVDKRAGSTMTFSVPTSVNGFPLTAATTSVVTVNSIRWATPAANASSVSGWFECSWTANAEL